MPINPAAWATAAAPCSRAPQRPNETSMLPEGPRSCHPRPDPPPPTRRLGGWVAQTGRPCHRMCHRHPDVSRALSPGPPACFHDDGTPRQSAMPRQCAHYHSSSSSLGGGRYRAVAMAASVPCSRVAARKSGDALTSSSHGSPPKSTAIYLFSSLLDVRTPPPHHDKMR